MQNRSFENVVDFLPWDLMNAMTSLPEEQKTSITEIRLRIGQPLTVSLYDKQRFLTNRFCLSASPGSNCLLVNKRHIEDTYNKICDFSLHTHQNEIKQGYVSLKGGHRAGICGTAVSSDGKITFIKDVTSINLRIANQIVGSSSFLKEISGGILISGPPLCGKTTVIRDIIRRLAGNECGFKKVAVIDSRGEITGCVNGTAQYDIGITVDILVGTSKADGIEIAVRTMSPEYVVFDEITTVNEAKAVVEALNCGVYVITTIHVGSMEELMTRSAAKILINSGAIKTTAFIAGLCAVPEVRMLA
ncbi:MAG: ATPase, T2SS/T4P/T4SS family [Oscillospiraceae bacterium]